ncbi:MAG: hypothetical protein LUD84_01800 [Clostridiales bacterium]|nr:hypothetical protein [Clostridiales bacterium]
MATSITVSALYIGGVEMPTPALEGVTITQEKVWSSDTGRSSSGKMLGTIVGIKSKITIKWPVLTFDEVETIESAVSDADDPFVTVKYTDMTGTTVTKTMYFGTPTYTLYSGADGFQYVKDVTVDGIEQ